MKMVDVVERLANAEAAIKAAHRRLDEGKQDYGEFKREMKSDLKEIAAAILSLTEKMDPLFAWMNQGKGKAAVVMLICSGAGSVITMILGALFKKS
jgi:hypothetical protein